MTSNGRLAYFNDIPVANAYPKLKTQEHPERRTRVDWEDG